MKSKYCAEQNAEEWTPLPRPCRHHHLALRGQTQPRIPECIFYSKLSSFYAVVWNLVSEIEIVASPVVNEERSNMRLCFGSQDRSYSWEILAKLTNSLKRGRFQMVLKNESILSLCQTCTARSSSSFVHLALILLAGSGKTLQGHKIRTLQVKFKILCYLPNRACWHEANFSKSLAWVFFWCLFMIRIGLKNFKTLSLILHDWK